MKPLLDQLAASGVLCTVDAALGRLVADKSAPDGDAAGLAAALASAALAHGHSCLPLAELHGFLDELAQAADARVPAGVPDVDTIRAALLGSTLVATDATTPAVLVFDAHERIYLRRYFVYEHSVARGLSARLAGPAPLAADPQRLRAALDRAFAGEAGDSDQRTAALLALRSRLLLISGGPGSGKTTTVLRLLAFVVEQARAAGVTPPRIALAAPTGKAAARLSETLRTGAENSDAAIPREAGTVHRLLGMSRDGRPRHDRRNPLSFDLVVIDEASMLDLALAARLCDALALSTHLILLGDRDQLAAVEAGRVFGALCHAADVAGGYSPALARWLGDVLGQETQIAARPMPLGDAYIELRGNHRFDAGGAIGRLAAALRRGDGAAALDILGESNDEAAMRPVPAAGLASRIARAIVPHYAALVDAIDADTAFAIAERFRVLCALREGPVGATAINAAIEREFRRRGSGGDWYVGRLVIIERNDYRLGLFNGDIGVALPSGAHGALEVWFRNADGGLRALPPLMLGAVAPAYALTVHKAQGSEFDKVVVALPERDARVLTRELVYTAVTRARKEVELWTSVEILADAIARSTRRWSGLADAEFGSG